MAKCFKLDKEPYTMVIIGYRVSIASHFGRLIIGGHSEGSNS